MSLTEEIFGLLDDGHTTLVFPTENAARHYLSKYVRSRKSSVLATRAVAFDEFKRRFSPVHEDRPANKYNRLAFVASFLSSGSTGMSYLFSDRFSAYKNRFVPFITRILPNLAELEGTRIEDERLYGDLKILERAYGKYLRENGLFEPGWEKCSLANCKKLDGDYVLVGYAEDIPMQMLMEELGPVPNIRTLSNQESKSIKYEKYFTEEAEIETLFNRLEELKRQGVPTDDILISTPDFDGLRPRLERKALEYNIPLSFMRSLNLSDTVPGKFLNAVMRCIDEDLSFKSLENLLLNTALPYVDVEANRSLVNFMIENNVQSGSFDFSNDKLYNALAKSAGKELLPLYRTIKSSLSAIRRANDGDTLIRDLHGLAWALFGEGEFRKGEKLDRDVYSFMFAELSAIGSTVKESGLKMDGLFSIFMGELGNLSYVMQEQRTGIRVFLYGQDHLLDVPYHFVVGLNDSNCRLKRSYLDFLDDHEVTSRKVFDITDNVLGCYMALSPNVHISGSETSHDGAQSVPTFFIMGNLVRNMEPEFPNVFENAHRASLEQANRTALAPKGLDLSREGHGKPVDLSTVRLSYSSINNYARCPYMAYLTNNLTRTAMEDFEPARQDDTAMGEFLHKVIQRFMENHMGSPVRFEDLEAYHAEIETIMDSMLCNDNVFDEYTRLSLKGQYLDSLKGVLDLLLVQNGKKKGFVGTFIPIRNEMKLNANPQFTGSIDTVIEDESGNVYLLDYKKGKAEATYQLVLYKRLYEEDPQLGEPVKDCFFYSMKDAKFNGFDAPKWDEQSQKLDEDIAKTKDGYMTGDWVATPSKSSCENCAERAICRRRFNLQ